MLNRLSHLTNWNPLRGLTLPQMVSRIEQGERGDFSHLQWTYRFIEKRNPTVRGIKKKLLGALGRLDWDIKQRSDSVVFDQALADRQEKLLREAYEKISNLKKALAHPALADFRGYAHLEKIYAGSLAKKLRLRDPQDHRLAGLEKLDPWTVVELRPVPQWHFNNDGLGTDWRYDADAQPGPSHGVDLNTRDWIIHEAEDPASEIFSICHLGQETTDADWDAFMETYAVPAIFIIGPPNVAKDKEKEYQSTAEQIVGDGRGYLPNGSTVSGVDAPGGHSEVFEKRLRWLQELMVLAGTGGVLTMLSGNTGIGKGPADEHEDTWLDIAANVAGLISETLQEQFDDPLLDRETPGQPHLAYFELKKPEKTKDASAVLTDAKTAADAGYEMEEGELSEKSGYTLRRAGGVATGAQNLTAAGAANAATGEVSKQKSEVSGAAAAEPVAAAAAGTATAAPAVADAVNPKPSMAGEAKPGLVEAALADEIDVDARTFAPVKPYLDKIVELVNSGAAPVDVVKAIEEAIAAVPDLLGMLDVAAMTDAIEKATGTAAVQGVRDAISARSQKSEVRSQNVQKGAP